MYTFLRILAALILVGVLALAAFIFVPVQLTPPQTELAADYQVPEGSGKYAMQLSDCAACHTAVDGERFAGGRAIESPMGVIYSSNITPDPETGIGDVTLDQFRAALYDGIGKHGEHLYPAMPYDNYRKLTEPDVRALYAYFMDEVPPVRNEVKAAEMGFPFNQRWGIRAWKWVALDKAGFTPEFDDEQLDRGAYLVEGPGHCGACHSPRNQYFAQAGYTAANDRFLTGGEIGGWHAPDLREPNSAPQKWAADQLAHWLRTGRNNHAGVSGEMQLVVGESLQYLSDEDVGAMVAYLRHIGRDGPAPETPPARPETSGKTEALLASADPGMELGARLYLDNCNACHFVDGLGANEIFPELDGNSLVNAPGGTGLINIILHGAELPSTEIRPMRLRMPGFANRLTDDEVATLANFVRSGWSNSAAPIDADAVAALRDRPAEAD
ncbi:cytochrome c [Pseudorhodobacter sp.]|uniref:cytochrome c n=1 Tax=Pseudorhodobacter sp. TaxID=1934400 RepID=UPI0026476EBF|nr:cytochrome c [Pseudorhodobacter sp.]MDN5788226.1 cytochrome c [Pseudorhodobacter sp.]